jgi:glycosyltransferase involved in cell wall biosynthesis
LLPRAARYRGGYDGEVVALGNSEFHAAGLRLVRSVERDWVILAHDVRLTGLYRHSVSRGGVSEGFIAAFTTMYPGCEGIVEDGWVPPQVAADHGVFMARELIARARVFATTSRYAAALARLDAAPTTAGKVAVLPFAYPAVVPRRPGDEDPRLICSFGLVNASKQPLLLIDAVALLRTEARLVFVGPVAEELRRQIQDYASTNGVAVDVTGYTSPEAYDRWLRQAAVAVQLRQVTNGETSAAVGDCLTHGVPTIVSDLGAARELPCSVTKLAVDTLAAELAAILNGLLEDPRRRHELGAQSQRWVAERGFDAAADDLLALIATRAAAVLAH